MRNLFTLDQKNYDVNAPKFIRPSVRGIIIKNDKIYMVHSLKYDYYKFPGGGIDEGESHIETLLREVREESGLIVIPESIKEYGLVQRIEKGTNDNIFIQDNFYYLCSVKDCVKTQDLDDYEAFERFTLELVKPQTAIEANRKDNHGPKSKIMIEREALVLEALMDEGYFTK